MLYLRTKLANTDISYVKIWARIEKDEDGYPKLQDWEDLRACPLRDGLVEIQSVPFFLKNIAVGDIAATDRAEDGRIVLRSVVERSGHSTFRVWLNEDVTPERDGMTATLKDLGARVEVTFGRLVAIDAPPEHEADIWDYLEAGQQASRWDLQVGHSPD